MTDMDKWAMYVGYATMLLSALGILCLAAWCVTELLWLQVKRVRGLTNIVSALRLQHDSAAQGQPK